MTLTPRHTAILRAQRRYFFMTTAQIRDASAPADKDGSVTREHLRKLLALGFTKRHEPRFLETGKATAPPVFLPTVKGSCALAVATGDVNDILHVEPTFRDWISIHHYTALTSLHMTIDAAFAAQTHVTQHALYFEHEVVQPDALEPSKKFRLNTIVSDTPRIVCCPDSGFEVEVGGHRRAIYVEREMGSDTPQRAIAKKHKGMALLSETGLFRRHFPLAKDMRVLAICPNPSWRDALRAAFKERDGVSPKLKAGAHLWLFVAAQYVAKEAFLHEPMAHVVSEKEGVVTERGPLPFVPPPTGYAPKAAPAAGVTAGASAGGTK